MITPSKCRTKGHNRGFVTYYYRKVPIFWFYKGKNYVVDGKEKLLLKLGSDGHLAYKLTQIKGCVTRV